MFVSLLQLGLVALILLGETLGENLAYASSSGHANQSVLVHDGRTLLIVAVAKHSQLNESSISIFIHFFSFQHLHFCDRCIMARSILRAQQSTYHTTAAMNRSCYKGLFFVLCCLTFLLVNQSSCSKERYQRKRISLAEFLYQRLHKFGIKGKRNQV